MPIVAEQNLDRERITNQISNPESIRTPEKEFAGKVVLITGSSNQNGIGAATAREFAHLGAMAVIITGRPESFVKAEPLLDELQKIGTQPFFVPGDITDPETSYQLVRGSMERFGKINVLVNSAGITRDKPMTIMTTEDWDDVFDTNTRPAFLLLKEAMRQKSFPKSEGGAVVHLSSIVGIYGNIGQDNYSASKSALIGLTRSQAQRLGSRGIRVNAVAPGFIDTNMTDGFSQEVRDAIKAATPLKRIGTPEDVAHLITFLASSRASFITGQAFEIDGGLDGGIIGMYGLLSAGYTKK